MRVGGNLVELRFDADGPAIKSVGNFKLVLARSIDGLVMEAGKAIARSFTIGIRRGDNTVELSVFVIGEFAVRQKSRELDAAKRRFDG